MIIDTKLKTFLLVFVILFLALSLRIYIATFHSDNYDLNLFKQWSKESVVGDIFSVYKRPVESGVYAPYLFIYFLKLSGSIYKGFFSPSFNLASNTLSILIKSAAIFFDLLTGYLIFLLLKKSINFKAGLLGLLFYVFNPGIIYLSAYWGQIDALYTLLVFISIIFLSKSKFYLSWFFIILAVFTKPQSIIFVPLIFFLNLKVNKKALARLVVLIPVFIFIILSPIILSGNLFNFVRHYFYVIGRYPYVSVNAFNPWWLLSKGFGLILDNQKLFGLIPFFYIGIFLFLISYIFIIYIIRKYNHKFIYLASSFIAFSFFMLPTQIHERYLFPIFVFLSIVWPKNKQFLIIYIILTLTFFANLIAVLPFFQPVAVMGHSYTISLIFKNIGALINSVVYVYFIYIIIKTVSVSKQINVYNS